MATDQLDGGAADQMSWAPMASFAKGGDRFGDARPFSEQTGKCPAEQSLRLVALIRRVGKGLFERRLSLWVSRGKELTLGQDHVRPRPQRMVVCETTANSTRQSCCEVQLSIA